MKTLKHKSRGEAVFILEELLVILGYDVYVSNYFGLDTKAAVMDFQSKNDLVVDALVGPKTWSKLIEKKQQLVNNNDKFLAERDVLAFAQVHNLELAVVKAVNSVESRGKGFLVSGKPVILFEGHVFWRQLEKRGVNPSNYLSESNKNVLYKKWTRNHYVGGEGEYNRLEKAAKISNRQEFLDAAYCSASWGAFQIMGYHYQSLGYTSIDDFVSKMKEHEREHLNAFGKYISVNRRKGKALVDWLREKNWREFAHGYNGSGYEQNNYHTKLQKAYERFSN